MGALADAAIAAGGEVIGVIPRALVDAEIAHPGLTDLRVVGSMHERKAMMADLADGFVALPGGLGTLDELTEVTTWAQLGLHAKPIGLLDPLGYFDLLLRFLDHAVDERFLRPEHRTLLLRERAVDPLLDAMAAWTPTAVAKWLLAELLPGEPRDALAVGLGDRGQLAADSRQALACRIGVKDAGAHPHRLTVDPGHERDQVAGVEDAVAHESDARSAQVGDLDPRPQADPRGWTRSVGARAWYSWPLRDSS
jgi:uncharacterized protein (TIGR00730 family)